jgi:thioredoxin 1
MADECVVSITDDQFEDEVLRNPGTVLVDFYTSWCPPCRRVAPTVEALCSEKSSSLKVVKMDAVENPKTASEHGVSAVPTFVLFHAGKKVGQLSGVQSKVQFEKWIASSVSGAA